MQSQNSQKPKSRNIINFSSKLCECLCKIICGSPNVDIIWHIVLSECAQGDINRLSSYIMENRNAL